MADQNSLIRVGKVSSIDTSKKKARVYYPSMNNMVSDWLPVLQYPGIATSWSGSHQHSYSGGETGSSGNHNHTTSSWMPKVNDKVLVIMEFGFNSGGYVVGVIP